MKRWMLAVLVAAMAIPMMTSDAFAFGSYLNEVNATCGTSYGCGICHVNPGGGGPLTADGTGYLNSGYDPSYFCSTPPPPPPDQNPPPPPPPGDGKPGKNKMGAPANLQMVQTSGYSVSLTWDPVPGAVEYAVYRREGKSAGQLGTTTGTSYSDDTLLPGISYQYMVMAVDANGMMSRKGAKTNKLKTLALNGAPIYEANCSGCHGPLGSSSKAGASAADIQYAIDSNVGNMGGLSGMSSGEVGAVAQALANDSKGPKGPKTLTATVNGPDVSLFWSSALDDTGVLKYEVFRDSSKIGETAGLNYADNGLPSGTYGYFVQALDKAGNSSKSKLIKVMVVGGTQAPPDQNPPPPDQNPPPPPDPAPVDGAQLYADNCASCHGDLANSNKKGITLTRLQNAINGNVGGMGYLNTMTTTELQAIVDALVVVPPPPDQNPPPPPPPPDQNPPPPPPPDPVLDGALLYANNCAGCHGDLANSNKKGITLTRLQNAISNNVAGMGYLNTLTTAQLQAIVDALVVVPPPPDQNPPPPPPPPDPAPIDGAQLYANNCAGCHGDLANSNKAGRTVTQIQDAIDKNNGGMGYLNFLTPAEVQAIADALATVAPKPPTSGVDLYNAYCASCHRSIDNSQVRNKSASSIKSAISNNKGGMGYLNFLTDEELQKIADALRQ